MASIERNDDPAINQIDETELRDIGKNLIELAERLRTAGVQLEGRSMLDPDKSYVRNDMSEMSANAVEEENSATRAAFRDTLTAMRQFRRGYERWERLTAEYALARMHYSQRDAAQALGVAASTINRWAQHPLPIEDYR